MTTCGCKNDGSGRGHLHAILRLLCMTILSSGGRVQLPRNSRSAEMRGSMRMQHCMSRGPSVLGYYTMQCTIDTLARCLTLFGDEHEYPETSAKVDVSVSCLTHLPR